MLEGGRTDFQNNRVLRLVCNQLQTIRNTSYAVSSAPAQWWPWLDESNCTLFGFDTEQA